MCPRGEIGRHQGFKLPCPYGREDSNSSGGTTLFLLELIMKLKNKIKKHPYKDKDGKTYIQFEDISTPIEYRDMVGQLEPYFGVLYNGEVYSKRTKRLISQHIHPNGYKVFATRLKGRKDKALCLKVHREIAKAYVPNPENKPFVNHKDGIKINNIPPNLEWCTNQENIRHAFDNGLVSILRGTDAVASKLTNEQVEEIRSLAGKMTHRAIANKFNIAHSQVTRILNNKCYNRSSYYATSKSTKSDNVFYIYSLHERVAFVRMVSGY